MADTSSYSTLPFIDNEKDRLRIADMLDKIDNEKDRLRIADMLGFINNEKEKFRKQAKEKIREKVEKWEHI